MTYSIEIHRRARRELGQMSGNTRDRVIAAIRGTDPRPAGCIKLRDREAWRIRAGDYRVLYTIDDERRAVTVVFAGLRSDAYR